MTTENWLLQVSPKLADGTLINLRGKDPEEFGRVVAWATENAAKFVDVVAAINAVPAALAGNVTKTQVVNEQPPQQGGWAQPQQAPAPSWSQPDTSQGPACQHGPMVFRQAKPGSGKDWKGYFCPTPQGTPNQCKPQFQK